MAGRIIGNYQIQDELDHGNLGALYRGRHLNLNTDVVIREIHLATFPVSTRVQLKARFRRELFIQTQLNHPSIARVYQSFVKGDNYYVVSEYVPGMSLRELLEREGLPTAPQALYICKQALVALEYAHALTYLDESDVQRVGVIHRDIKPSNLVIDGQGKLKITDFGIVRMPDRQTLAPPIFQPGTMEYMAPEQVRGLEPDARADIYSLGVTFYQVLTGHLPYPRSAKTSDSALHDTILDQEPPLISEFRSDVNPALANIFARSFARNPGSRFQSAGEFLASIRQYERSYNQVESPSTPFSARPVKNLNERAQHRPSTPAVQNPLASPIQTAPINPPAEKRHSIDRSNRTTLSMPGQIQGASTESGRGDSGGLSGRRVTSPLPRPDQMNIPPGTAAQPHGAQAMAKSGMNEEMFFIDGASSGNRVGWVVAAALTMIAVFAGLYLFVLKEDRPDQSLAIKAPVSATDMTAAAAAVNPNPIDPVVSVALTKADIDRLNQAREADRLGKFNTAITLYGAFLQSAPESAESARISEQLDRLRKFVAHLNAAKSAFNRQDYRTARDNYSEALKLRPYSRLVQNGIAQCNARLGGGSGMPGSTPDASTRPRRTTPPAQN